MKRTRSRLEETARTVGRARRQEVRKWHRRAGRHVVFRFARVALRGVQIGVGLVVAAYLCLDFLRLIHAPNQFTVPHIEVIGNTRVRSEEVMAVARLAPSISLWAWPLDEIRERAELHPRIKTARVSRDFPDELVIHVQEREPVALLLGPTLIEVDADGIVLGFYERGQSPVRPIITGHGLPGLMPGDHIQSVAVQQALALITSYERSGSHERVRLAEVALGGADGPVIWLDPGVQVPCPPTTVPMHWARLDAVLGDLQARGTGLHRVAAIDLRFAHIVPVRMRTVATG